MNKSQNKYSCPVCTNKEFKHFKNIKFLNGTTSIKECTKCKLRLAYPKVSKQKLEKYYAENYFPTDFETIDKYNKYDLYKAEQKAKLITKYSKLVSGKNFLEIGSATGALLHIMNKKGFKVEGVEPAISFANYSKNKYNLKIHPKMLENIKFKNKFDIITAYQTFYYFEYPIRTLKQIHSLLKKGGIFIMTNQDGSKKHERAYLPFYFTINAYEPMLKRNGFKILDKFITDEVKILPKKSVHLISKITPEFIKTKIRPYFYGTEHKNKQKTSKGDNIVIIARKI